MTRSVNAYDELEYPTRAFPDSHVDRLAALGRLYGLDTPDIESCRVLEVGCSTGVNLLSMAHDLPGSRFVGIDLAETPLGRGREAVRALGLANVEFRHADLATWDEAGGEFDFIIAHGVYTWVPPAVADRLLALCGKLLSARGLAFISFVPTPAGHLRRAVREAVLFHAQRNPDERERTAEARIMLSRIEAMPGSGAYLTAARWVGEQFRSAPDPFFRHDLLSDAHESCPFLEFTDRAARHGLGFVTEAEFWQGRPERFPPETAEFLAGIEDPLIREQYVDYLSGTGLRQSVLCRAGRKPKAAPANLRGLRVAAPVALEPAGDSGMTKAVGLMGSVVETDEPPVLAVLEILAGRWPAGAAYEELAQAAASAGAADAEEVTAAALFQLASVGFIDLSVRARRFVTAPGERPEACPFARWIASRDTWIPSRGVKIAHVPDPFVRELIQVLDGTRTLPELERELSVRFPGRPVGAALAQALPKLAAACLLVA